MITYNHEPFIKEAIEGVLKQKTNFEFELVIGEDHSTDMTRVICEEYASRNPQINLLPPAINLGMMLNFIRTLTACKSKYIALCEGDDYWTDPNKLQLQVDFLEANPDFSVCFHQVKILENGRLKKDPFTKVPASITTALDLARIGNYIHTCSSVFRNKNNYCDLPADIQPGDYALHLFNTRDGEKIKYLNQTMAIYRIHPGGVWRGADAAVLIKKELGFYITLKDLFPEKISALLLARFFLAFTNYYESLTVAAEKDEFLKFSSDTLKTVDRKTLLGIIQFKSGMESNNYILHLLKNKLLRR